MADDNPNISLSQKTIIRTLLTGPYFVPFSYEGEWDYTYSNSKIKLVELLLDGRWGFDLSAAFAEDDIYILIISFDRPVTIEKCSKNRYISDQREEAKAIEIYLPYSCLLQLYKAGIQHERTSYWQELIKNEDK
ncbi:hypothetical protein A8L34_27865 [Bacillus sp. FJAT-27264]|uniref:hypothetical protein n=1 Tax=Paenibacillus sp. (strain DSM 101736 / FJAT-27264) TaxID=1850362 RepID=UPI000807CCDE|nr:hypothetical protein [Bacillus sp. FJAT-27264]OBZ15866.1 hypothetical protein A8L34_27865 [Bacillus sp. FJAT-27264]